MASRIVQVVLIAALALGLTASAASAAGTLRVSIIGSGTVTGAGLNCSHGVGGSETGTCSVDVPDEKDCDPDRKPPCIFFPQTVFITPTGTNGFDLDHWTGDCAAASGVCGLRMDDDHTVTAVFADVTDPTVSISSP